MIVLKPKAIGYLTFEKWKM